MSKKNIHTWPLQALVIVALQATGCSSRHSPDWTSPESVQTVASALAIAPEDSELHPVYQALLEGDACVIQKCELRRIDRPFLMTAYAAPVLEARRTRTPRFSSPIRGLPPSHISGEPLPSRRDLGDAHAIAWVADPLDAYLAEVNGSVRLVFPDDETACLAWTATNELPYTSLGHLLVERGQIDREDIDLAAIQRIHERDPALVQALMLENQRAVFFEEIPCESWPRASTGAVLRPGRSVAVDPDVIALGSVLVLETILDDGTELSQLVAAVDIGGAIKGGRIDLYIGAGPEALRIAGAQVQHARVFLLLPPSGGEQSDRK